jgi:hypothetical protein
MWAETWLLLTIIYWPLIHGLLYLNMSRLIPILTLMIFSCIKIESPYEDLNDIYLQWTGSALLYEDKILFDEDTPYGLSSDGHEITRYRYIYGDSCSVFGIYSSANSVADFAVQNCYLYLACKANGLDIINFQSDEPFLYSNLALNDSLYNIHLVETRLFLFGKYRLYIIDIADRQHPKKIGEYVFERCLLHTGVDSAYAYALAEENNFYIIDVKYPDDLQLILHYKGDTTAIYDRFATNANFIYFVHAGVSINIYEFSNGNLSYVSEMHADYAPITYLNIYGKYGLALSQSMVYLLNAEYPSRPCICEKMRVPVYGHFNFGTINGKTIYAIDNQMLHFIEIRDVPQ